MQRTSTILCILALLTGPAVAQSNDDIRKRLDALEKENAALRARVNKLEGPPIVTSYEPVRSGTVVTQTEMKPTAGYDAPPLSVPTRQIDQWSGIYVGGSFGAGLTQSHVTSSERPVEIFPTNSPPFVTQGQSITGEAEGHDGFGGLIDLYLGVNKQIGPNLVLGLQLEGSAGDMNFDARGIRAYTYFNDAGPTGQTGTSNFRPQIHSSFMVSALARAGWLVDPATMLYALAGYTGAQFRYENLPDNSFFELKDQFWANGVTVCCPSTRRLCLLL